MASRLKLQAELEELLGSKNVYFQPPETLQMKYPCIRYHRSPGERFSADNNAYVLFFEYTLIYMDRKPDNSMIEKILKHFPMSRYDRHYTVDGLNHDIITIYY